MRRVDAVVFDIGNVLLPWAPEAMYDRVVGPARRAAFFASVPIMEMNEKVDLGLDIHEMSRGLAMDYPDWAAEIHMWADRWIETICPPITQTVNHLRRLKADGVPVLALSNFGDSTFDLVEAQHDFLTLFDLRFISARVGMIKPDPAFYALLEEQSGFDPATLFFIDDRAENIAAASARGWQTHHFADPDALGPHLRELGLSGDGG